MIDVVGVRFKKTGKIYYFDPRETGAKISDEVIVETVRGLEFGKIVNEKSIDEEIFSEIKPVIRIATDEDIGKHIDNRNKAREAAIIFENEIEKHGLDMRLSGAEYTFDNSKLLFYFTAEKRVDFRELVRDLAAIFKTRIELRQIGVRDQAKTVGGLGCCGRATCCSTFISEFSPVSIKMAKDQGLSLNPSKISGICGRLMCCLKYEQDGYECILKKMPRIGEIVETEKGKGTVVSTYTIQELVKVAFKDQEESEFLLFEIDEIKRTREYNRSFKKDLEDTQEENLKILKELEGE
ncbi:MAG: PSP1 domain-containing protein [Peptoniphilaceae bacterium]